MCRRSALCGANAAGSAVIALRRFRMSPSAANPNDSIRTILPILESRRCMGGIPQVAIVSLARALNTILNNRNRRLAPRTWLGHAGSMKHLRAV